MNDCSLSELGFKGLRFTQHNKQLNETTIQARLDRALAIAEWRLMFEQAIVIHEHMLGSDHRPLVIQLEKRPKNRRQSFKYEFKWSREVDCNPVIKQEWEAYSRINARMQIPEKLHRCATTLMKRRKKKIGDSIKILISSRGKLIIALKEILAQKCNRRKI